MNKAEKEVSFLRNIFGKFTKGRAPNVIDNLEKDIPEEMECGYIIFELIQDDTFESILSNLLSYSQDKKFLIEDIYGTILILSLRKNMFFKEDEEMEVYLNGFIENIPVEILKKIRFIYGIEKAKVGIFGSNDQWHCMVLLNNYFEKILKIANLKYGEKMEIKTNL